jgi:hypothetical protein
VSRACPEPPPGTDARKRNPPEPKYRYEEDSPIGDSLAMAIGHMVQQWGHLEDNASILTALAQGASALPFSRCSDKSAHDQQIRRTRRCGELDADDAKSRDHRQTCERAKKLTGERNRIIHGSWYPTKNPDVAGRYTYSAEGE